MENKDYEIEIKKLCNEVGEITMQDLISNIDRKLIGDKMRRVGELTAEKERRKVLELMRLKIICRTRGLQVDINTQKNTEYFRGAREEFETFLYHLKDSAGVTLRWIIADIECAKKYLTKEEINKFIELTGD